MSDNLSRILTLLEHLSSAKEDGMQITELVEQTKLASSTVYRLTNELEALGYLRKSADRRLFPKFMFEQGLVVGGIEITRLSEACRVTSSQLITASEFISLQQQNLRWHIAHEHPQQSIRLRAAAGFIRGAYELDCISRIALSHIPIADIKAHWDIAGFYDVGVSGSKVQWSDVQKQIASVHPDEMQFDLMGNAKGVRRFCVAIRGPELEFAGMLTVAEAATPLRDVEGHVAKVRAVLLDIKEAVETGRENLTTEFGQHG